MNKKKLAALATFLIGFTGFVIPENAIIPVEGAGTIDWHPQTFWYEPWGRSGVHKGIDIFAKADTPLLASTPGIVIFRGNLSLGGHVIAVLGPKWRIHYFAHLNSSEVGPGSLVSRSQVIGAVGDTGNARGKQPHVHYSVITLIPYPWRWDASTQGWKKVFFLDPGRIVRGSK